MSLHLTRDSSGVRNWMSILSTSLSFNTTLSISLRFNITIHMQYGSKLPEPRRLSQWLHFYEILFLFLLLQKCLISIIATGGSSFQVVILLIHIEFTINQSSYVSFTVAAKPFFFKHPVLKKFIFWIFNLFLLNFNLFDLTHRITLSNLFWFI